ERGAARARRCNREDLVSAIGAANKGAALRLIRLQIVACDEAAMSLHVGLDQARRLPFIESWRALPRDAIEGAGQVGLLQDVSRFVRGSLLRELGERGGMRLHPGEGNRQRVRQTDRDDETA